MDSRGKRALASVLVASFASFSIAGCSGGSRHDESLDGFASAYVNFRKALRDTEIVSWAIALDQSEDVDAESGTNYRMAFVRALDTKISNRQRADAAAQALGFHNSTHPLDDFETRNDAVDETSLALVQAANAVKDERHRQQAVLVATSARRLEQSLTALRNNYVDTYYLQTNLLDAIVREKGDLGRVFTSMRDILPEKNKLWAEGQTLRKEEQTSLSRVQEQYAAFRGMTGIVLDYADESSGGNTKK